MAHICCQIDILKKIRNVDISLQELKQFEFKVVVGSHILIMMVNTVGLLILGGVSTSKTRNIKELTGKDLACFRNEAYKRLMLFCYLFYGFGIILHTVCVLLRLVVVLLKKHGGNEDSNGN